MFLLTVLDGALRALSRRVDGPTCVDLSEAFGPSADGPWVAWPDVGGRAVALRAADHRPVATLHVGERVTLGGLTLHLTRDDPARTDLVVPVRRRAPLGLRVPGRRAVPLGRGRVVIGSSLACDVVLDDPAVSPRHCEVVATPEGWTAWDLGSANGLWAGGARVPFAALDAGAVITLGRTRVECVPLDEVRPGGAIVGDSEAIERVRREIDRVAPAPYAVLIEGESGVGKELVAREIHARSPRRDGPLVSVNCGAIAPELIESELFGHERGAFTGASVRRKGLFEEAHGGTLFLDEVGELPLALQPKLLRVLETGEVRRVGSDGVTRVDVRVVSATLRDLDRRVADGAFRDDLFFRLQDFRVRVPPLRERPGDIPALADTLLARIGRETGLHRRLEDRALARLMAWRWPGNVRELFAALKRAVFASPGPAIGVDHLSLALPSYAPSPAPGVRDGAWPASVPAGDLAALHAWCGGNLTRVARITGLARSTIRARLAKAQGAGRAGAASP